MAASLCYMANGQRDAAGLIIFDEDVQELRRSLPPARGSCSGCCTPSRRRRSGTHTDFAKPFVHFQNFLHRRGIVVVISDFYEQPEDDHQDRGAAALSRQRSDPVPHPRSAGDQAEVPRAACCWWTWRPRPSSKCRRSTRATSTGKQIDAHIEALRDQARARAWIIS